MNNALNIDWNNYLYKGNAPSLVEQLRNIRNMYRQTSLSKIPSKQERLPRNNYGVPRIAYYGGFTTQTNIPVANKNGGNI